MLDISLYEDGDRLLVRLSGRIVLDECDRLKSTLTSAIGPSIKQIGLDMAAVDFVDSAGLGALVGIKVSASKHKARLALLNPSRGVTDILVVSKLDSLFDLVTGEEARQLVEDLNKDEFFRTADKSSEPAPPRPATPAIPSVRAEAGGEAQRGPSLPPAQPAGADAVRAQVEQLCHQAIEHLRRGDYKTAANCYEQAVEIDPAHLAAQNNLAIVYERQPDQAPKAIAQWERVLAMSRESNDQRHIDRALKHLEALRPEPG